MPIHWKHQLLLTTLLFISERAYCDTSISVCTTDTCKSGTIAITYATKTEPYYSCPTRELADYSNIVLSFVAMNASTGGALPNISDKTGEPEYEGETKNVVDSLRTAARVTSFNQAIALCQRGKKDRKVVVINVPQDAMLAVYVHDLKSGLNYWMPIGMLEKKP